MLSLKVTVTPAPVAALGSNPGIPAVRVDVLLQPGGTGVPIPVGSAVTSASAYAPKLPVTVSARGLSAGSAWLDVSFKPGDVLTFNFSPLMAGLGAAQSLGSLKVTATSGPTTAGNQSVAVGLSVTGSLGTITTDAGPVTFTATVAFDGMDAGGAL